MKRAALFFCIFASSNFENFQKKHIVLTYNSFNN